MLASLYIVIINWNLKADTLECLISLLKAGATLEQLIVVDNASTDGSVQLFKAQFGERLTVIENQVNLGYAGGLNQGISFALGLKANWLLLLNNDTVVDELFLVSLEKSVQTNTDYAIFSPMILEYKNPDRIWSIGDRKIGPTLLTRNLGFGKKRQSKYPPILPVDFISGCAMLIHRDVFEKVGFFSTQYFMYAEEIDFCWKARLAGFRTATATRAILLHKVSASATEPVKNRYWRIYNQIRFYRKYAERMQIPLLFVFTLARSGIIALHSSILRRSDLANASVSAWLDGWFRPQ
jgi:GT2 family glycosyltransferase